MVRLIAGTMALWGVIALLVCGARVLGVTKPLDDQIAATGFGLCDGQPCFMGVVPGVTAWKDAQAISGDTILSQSDVLVVLDYRASRIQIVRSATQAHVTSLIVDFSGSKTPPPDLGSFVDKFGPPCGVWTLATPQRSTVAAPGIMMLIYPSMAIQPRITDGKLSLADPVREVLLLDPQSILGSATSECSAKREGTVQVGQWLGFGSLSHYRQRGPVN